MDGLSGTIGLITSSLDADYTRRLIAGATEVLSANGLSSLCFSPGASGTTEYEMPLGFLDLVDPRYLSGVVFSRLRSSTLILRTRRARVANPPLRQTGTTQRGSCSASVTCQPYAWVRG